MKISEGTVNELEECKALCLILFDLLAQKQNSSPGHIETRRALKEIPLVSEFDAVLARCTLNDEDKAILRMHYVQRKDFRYIGDSLGFSERTIKERHRESLRKISHVLLPPFWVVFFCAFPVFRMNILAKESL